MEVNKDFSEELGVQWGVSGNLDTDGAITEGVDLQGATNASNTDFLVDLAGGGTL
ncbi:MAG: hypothetical protein GWO24_15680, partial [Akkermansiaceae bacterium]|nr:hypothetical protein [Akkermansiaceae bacterium]